MIMMMPLWDKPSGLYRLRRGLGLYKVGYREKESSYLDGKLSFHAKESPIRTRVRVFGLVSSQLTSPAHINSPDVRGPLNPGLPHMHTLVFSEKNEIVCGELPAEIQSLGP